MIPILFAENETNFTTNGIGRMADAITCKVNEKRNGIFELTMTYPVDGSHFADVRHSRILYAPPADGKTEQPFRIDFISKPLNGIVEIKALHISSQLSHIPVSPFTAQSVTGALAGLSSYAAETCPFTFWTDKSTVAAFKVEVPSSIRSLLGGQRGSVLDVYGGEYEFDGYTVKLHNERGSDRGVTLRYGKNIIDIRQEENIANTYTGVMPYWSGMDASNAEVLVMLQEKVLHAQNAQNFPYQRTIPLDLSNEFENAPTEAQLRTRAQAYMAANDIGKPAVNVKVSFVALWQTEEYKDIANLERVNLCDTVTVEFPALGISVKAQVVETTYDVLAERYESIELGNERTTLAGSIAAGVGDAVDQATGKLPTKTFLQQSVERATDLITGGLGGYVLIKQDANGKPEEILIMDSDDVNTAVNVIRMNRNGIGFSSNGYAGPFQSAWTIDGHFVADFIDTGTLQANLIKAGRLQDAANVNYWDMVSGEFKLTPSSVITGQNETLEDYIDDEAEGYVGAAMTQQNIFNKLTNNGQTQGIYLQNGLLYINGEYLQTGQIASNWIKLGGKMTVYKGKKGETGENVAGGYIGYATGSSGGQQTSGMWFKNAAENCYLIVTDAGVRMTADVSNNGGCSFYVIPTGAVCTKGLSLQSGGLDVIGNVTVGGHMTFNKSQGSAVWDLKDVRDISADRDIGGRDITASNILTAGVQVKSQASVWAGTWIYATGDLSCSGTKSRVVNTDDYADRLLYSYEMPSPIFGDLGSGIIAEDGKAYIYIDPVFAETVNTSNYQVFLQAYGPDPVYVSERTPAYFIVDGEPGTEFGWEIKAKQADFDQKRMEIQSLKHEPENDPDFTVDVSEQIDLGEAALNHLIELREGRTA